MTSLMRAEAREAPALVAAALREDVDLYQALGRALRARPPAFVATVARGSSDHAASYGAYLFGLATGRETATLPPSLVTRYGARMALDHALVVGISQSGAGPDLVRVMAAADEAVRIAVVNAEGSALAAEADWVLPQRAGPERAVAATKSFVLTMVCLARLVAAWTQDAVLAAALLRLPERLEEALACDWSAGLAMFAAAERGAFVVGRGPVLAVAAEAALKLKETSYMHAEAVSSAEIQHGRGRWRMRGSLFWRSRWRMREARTRGRWRARFPLRECRFVWRRRAGICRCRRRCIRCWTRSRRCWRSMGSPKHWPSCAAWIRTSRVGCGR